jgi:hypothetical protein
MKKVYDEMHKRFYVLDERKFENGIEVIILRCLDKTHFLNQQQMTAHFFTVLIHRKQLTYETR